MHKQKKEFKSPHNAREEAKDQQIPMPSLKNFDKKNELKIYGENAALAAFERRSSDVVRVYVDTNKVKNFRKLLKQSAEKKIAYKVISAEELNKVTESTHHEGVCLIVKKKEVINFKKFLAKQDVKNKRTCIVALQYVQNPHNIGAILRVCANFAVDALLLQEPEVSQSGAVFRTAEGGAEWVQIIETGELLKSLEEFKKRGFTVYGTSSHAGVSLTKLKFSEKSIILFGSEAEGLSLPILNICDQKICIPQSGHVESLNVACAASVVLYENFKASCC